MKRTIEMITMTLIIIVVAAFFGSTLMGCGGDDDSIIAISNDDGVRGGEVYNQWGKPETDPNDPLASFFQEELHAPYWDGQGNEYKTFFEHGDYDKEICLMINSRQEFQQAYMGSKPLPDVDFSKYTLLIGRTWGNDGSFSLGEITLKNKNSYYELQTKLLHHVGGFATQAIIDIYFWRLYPKLEKKDIVMKRTVENVMD